MFLKEWQELSCWFWSKKGKHFCLNLSYINQSKRALLRIKVRKIVNTCVMLPLSFVCCDMQSRNDLCQKVHVKLPIIFQQSNIIPQLLHLSSTSNRGCNSLKPLVTRLITWNTCENAYFHFSAECRYVPSEFYLILNSAFSLDFLNHLWN